MKRYILLLVLITMPWVASADINTAASIIAPPVISAGLNAAIKGAAGGVPHPICIQWWTNDCKSGAQIPCKPRPTPPACTVAATSIFLKPAVGICQPTTMFCIGQSALGIGGQSGGLDFGLQALSGILQGVVGKLMQGGQGGGGAGGGAPTGDVYTNQPVVAPGTVGALQDTVNGVSGNGANTAGNTVNDILGSVFGETTVTDPATDPSDDLSTTSNTVISGGLQGGVGQGGATQNGTAQNNQDSTNASDDGETQGAGGSGGQGGVVTGNSEGAILAPEVQTVQDSGASPVGGFNGAANQAPQSSGALTSLCADRPWSRSVVARFISPSLFDGLCTRFGYQVGTPTLPVSQQAFNTSAAENTAQQQATQARNPNARVIGMTCAPEVIRKGSPVELRFSCGNEKLTGVAGFSVVASSDTSAVVRPQTNTQYGIRCGAGIVYSCAVRVVDPQLKLWSEPKTVSLGARAQLYWSTKDVQSESCTVVGPSFSEKGPQGGAATVPINDASTYTLTCTGLDGVPIQQSYTVDLSI